MTRQLTVTMSYESGQEITVDFEPSSDKRVMVRAIPRILIAKNKK